ncbi:AbrB family transcriptional regulator [Maritimibacter sp. UBA3975]|uniref:AbrB family transcriptional regulator n=1 Tax=Maritimibacter sp. UBA3975 TaxID=1946833 RepID=UPI000C0A0328|nr:AbrB family transcriptional regulator [Maritimibacter sp. UBA3975]MAM61592.1 aminopeptidase [Maritimibacter sp.]|tara:strand:- start:5667 stop:6728 length:1062 start_codon:yes stop_codon:yes gene_type:complete
MTFPPLRHNLFTLLLLICGGAAGFAFAWIGLPLPFMLGSLFVSAIAALSFARRIPENYSYPLPFRQLFVGVIGVMIGAQVSPDLLALAPNMAVTIPAILLFVVLAHSGNFLIFRKVGGLDRSTAFFSGSPGGLLEAISFGEESGADIRMLTILQFLRIIVVVVILPLGISIYEGEAVGSAAGLTLSATPATLIDVILVLGASIIGVWLGGKAKLPAAQLAGPLILVGIATAFGLVSLSIPGWLVGFAQVVVGTSLGLRFVGITRRMLLGGLGLALVSGVFMLALGGAMSLAVARATGFDLETLIISFAPGGVTEMSLIALSLAANPAFVTLHHLVRIVATVVELAVVRKLRLV